MHFSDKKFEEAYLKIISQQTEEPVIPTGVCKKCNVSFTDDIAKVGDTCPKCNEAKIEAYDAADYAGDGIDMPTPYEAPAEECNGSDCNNEDVVTECGNKDDILQEEDFAVEQNEEDEPELVDEQEESDSEQDIIDEQEQEDDPELVDEQEETDSEQDIIDEQEEDEDPELVDEEITDADLIPPVEVDDTLIMEQDEEEAEDDAEAEAEPEAEPTEDDKAAQEDTAEDDTEDTSDIQDAKIVSFTSSDPAILELLAKVQSGELKLVGVPLDFKFDEADNNTNPDLTAEVLQNFEIEPVVDESVTADEGEMPAEGTEPEAEDGEDMPLPEDTDEEEDKPEVVKESACCCKPKFAIKVPQVKATKPGKGSKYGPY